MLARSKIKVSAGACINNGERWTFIDVKAMLVALIATKVTRWSFSLANVRPGGCITGNGRQ